MGQGYVIAETFSASPLFTGRIQLGLTKQLLALDPPVEKPNSKLFAPGSNDHAIIELRGDKPSSMRAIPHWVDLHRDPRARREGIRSDTLSS
jgi:hypothetical protein